MAKNKKLMIALSILNIVAFSLSFASIGLGEWLPPGGICP